MTQYNRNRNGTDSSSPHYYYEPSNAYETLAPLSISYTSDGLRVTKAAGPYGSQLNTPDFNPPVSFAALIGGLKIRRNTAASGVPYFAGIASSEPGSGGKVYVKSVSITPTFSQVGKFITYPNMILANEVIPGDWDSANVYLRFPAGPIDVTITGFGVYHYTDSDVPTDVALDASDNVPAWTFTPNSLTASFTGNGANDEAVSQLTLDSTSPVIKAGTAKAGSPSSPAVAGQVTFPAAGIYTLRSAATYVQANGIKTTFTGTAPPVTIPTGPFSAAIASQANYLDVSLDASGSTYPAPDPPSLYTWDFGDGSAAATGLQQEHVYAAAGTYTVKLTMYSAATKRTATASSTITIFKAPDPANYFTVVKDLLAVTFAPSLTGASSYLWDFGDGTTSTEQSPVHGYAGAGSYPVQLTVDSAAPVSQIVLVRNDLRKLSLVDTLALEVAVPWADGVAYNRLPNPNGDQGAWGWVTPYAGAYVKSSTTADQPDDHLVPGTKLLLYSSGSGVQTVLSQNVPAAAGQYASAQLVVPYVDGYVRATVEALSSAGAVLGASTTTAYSNAATVQRTAPYLLPSGTVAARLRLDFYASTAGATPAAGKILQWRRAMLATAATSAELTANPYRDDVIWQDIIAPASSITISRAALNLGTLTAKILDSSFDPAISGTLRPGQRVRLRAQAEDAGGVVTPEYLFSGTLLNAASSYSPDLAADDPKSTTVTLRATDATTPLTQTAAPNGVGLLSELPTVLEAVGVPYEINGQSGQVATASIVAVNPNASALDQVAITRDSTSSYAFVDRAGTLIALDQAHMGAAPVGIVSEKTYSALDASFSTAKVVNSVSIIWLRYTKASANYVPASGTTPAVGTPAKVEQIPYGPYEDAASIALWGRQTTSRPFTIQGFAETEAAIATRAQAILAANKTPVRTISSATLPIRYVEDVVRAKALLDIYDPVTVRYDRTGTNTLARVTSIAHTITPKGWTVKLGFEPNGAVASPQLVAAPPGPATPLSGAVPVVGKVAVQVACTTAYTTTGALADVPGMTTTVTVTSTNQRFLVTLVFDVTFLNTGLFYGGLFVDSADKSTPQAVTQLDNTAPRGSVTQTWLVTGLAAGARVFKARAYSATAGAHRVGTSNSTLTVIEI